MAWVKVVCRLVVVALLGGGIGLTLRSVLVGGLLQRLGTRLLLLLVELSGKISSYGLVGAGLVYKA